MGVPEKIKEIEEEMKKTQRNKHTEHHIGLLKAKLAKLRGDVEKQSSKSGGAPLPGREGGEATGVLVGLPGGWKAKDLEKPTKTKTQKTSHTLTALNPLPR